jgi:hypothetical protein
MPNNLTDAAENLMMDWVNVIGTPTRPTSPIKVALVTVIGTDSAAGTEVVGGSYARQNANLTASSGGASTNSAEIRFTNMPAVTVVGVDLYDSAGSPVRLWWGPLAANKVVNAADDFVIAAGDLDLTLN